MPQAIPAIAAAAASAGGATAVQAAWIAVVVSTAMSMEQQASARGKARRAAENATRTRNITLRSAIAPRTIALGTVRTSGPLMYGEFVGAFQEYLDTIVAINHGELSELLGVYIGDEYIAAASITSQIPTTGKYGVANRENLAVAQTVAVTSATSATVSITPDPAWPAYATLLGGTLDSPAHQPLTGVSFVGTTVSWTETVTGNVEIGYQSIDALRPPIKVQWTLGAASQASTSWSVSAPKWTADHRLRGVAYVRTLKLIDHPLFLAGDSGDVGAVVRGPVGVWDPRTSAFVNGSSNPALLAAWFRTLAVADGGMGVPSAWIDWPSVGAAANVCDELISVRQLDGTGYDNVKRYECNTRLVLADGVTPADNLRIILDSMAGDFPFTGGLYKCFAGAFRSATVTITDDDVAAGDAITFAPQAGASLTPPNVVTATFYDAARGWVQQQAKAVSNAAYITADGAEELLELDLQASTDERQANYLMGVRLERERPALAGALTVTGKGSNLALLDTVQFSMQGYTALAGKTFEVRRRTNQFNGRYPLELREVKASSYTLDADRFTPPPAVAAPVNSILFDVAAPVITAVAEVLVRQADGSIISRAEVTLAAHSQAYVVERGQIRLRWRRAGAEWVYGAPAVGSTLKLYTGPLEDGAAVIVAVQAVNGAGAGSTWAMAAPLLVLGKAAPPANPASLAATQVPGGVLITWALNTEADYLDTEVRAGASWAAGALQWRGTADRYLLPWPAAGAITLWVAHRDTSKNYSATPGSVGLTVGNSALIGTPQIVAEAATELVSNRSALSYSFVSATGGFEYRLQRLLQISFTNTQSSNVVVELAGEIGGIKSSGPGSVWLGIDSQAGSALTSGVFSSFGAGTLHTDASSGHRRYTLSDSLTVAPNATIYLALTVYIFSAVGTTTNYEGDGNLRIVAIKR